MIRRSLLLFVSSTGLAGAQEKITYQDHVKPILENRCLNCHNAEKKKGGLDLSTYAATMAGGSGGVNLEPGDAGASQFFKVITHAAEPYMPPKSDKLPQNEIEVIAKWIAGGVPDSATSTAKVKKKAEFAMSSGSATGKPDGPPPMPEHLLLEPVVSPPRPNSVTAMAHSPWAPLVAVGSAKQVLLYHSETRQLLGVLPFPEGGFPESVSFTRNGALVLASGGVGGKKGLVAVWDVKTGKRVILLGEEFESIPSADITPDYKRIAIGTRQKRVKIYDTASGRKLHEIKKHTDWVTHVAFSPDGVLLATGDRNGGLFVWETATGGEFYNLKGHEKMIASLAWRGDSNLLASGSEDGNWIWWEMQNGGQVKKQAAHGGVLALHFGQDGRMVSGGRDGHVRIWNGSGAQTRDWVAAGGAMTLSAAFSQDSKTVMTGTAAGDIKVWDAAKDAPALGVLAYNPPPIETRIELAAKEVAAKQEALGQAQAAAAEREKAMAAMVEGKAAALKAMEAAAAAATAAAGEAAALREEAVKLARTKQDLTAGLEAAKQQLAAAPGAEVEAKVKTLAAAMAVYESDWAAKEQARKAKEEQAAAMKAKAEEAAKALPGMDQQVEAAQKALAEARPALEAANAAVAPVQREWQFWQAAKENKSVLALRDELAALKDKVEDLKAGIPALEAEVQSLTASKTASPAPKPEDLPKIDAKIAAAAARLEEAKKELAAAEPQLPEKEKAVEATWQKYLSLLPK